MKMVRLQVLGALATLVVWGVPTGVRAQEPAAPAQPEQVTRVREGLLLCYTFANDGELVIDEVFTDQPLDLLIETGDTARLEGGALAITGSALVASPAPAEVLPAACRASNEITIEAWVQPASLDQSGPARVVTLSLDTGQRNFTLGQTMGRYVVRLRTTTTGVQGTPEFMAPEGSVLTELTHVVFTRSLAGTARIYINGEMVAEGVVGGDLSNWEDTMRLALGNELTGDRSWLGSLSLVAIYDLPLTAEQVLTNFQAGSDAGM